MFAKELQIVVQQSCWILDIEVPWNPSRRRRRTQHGEQLRHSCFEKVSQVLPVSELTTKPTD